MNFSILLDFIVIALLVGTIIYAMVLNRKLASIYQSRGEMQQFLNSFTNSLAKAEQSMSALKGTGETAFAMVQEHMNQARALRDDLSFLVERGESIAVRLDETIRSGRDLQKDLDITSKHIDRPQSPSATPEPSNTESELIHALRNVR